MINQAGERRRDAIVEYLRAYAAEHHYPPSIDEIRAGCGLRSTSTVVHQLGVLERAGVVLRWPGKVRTIKLVEAH